MKYLVSGILMVGGVLCCGIWIESMLRAGEDLAKGTTPGEAWLFLILGAIAFTVALATVSGSPYE